MIVVESGHGLDAQVLPDVESWDIRRYGSTQIALRTLSRPDGHGTDTPRMEVEEETPDVSR